MLTGTGVCVCVFSNMFKLIAGLIVCVLKGVLVLMFVGVPIILLITLFKFGFTLVDCTLVGALTKLFIGVFAKLLTGVLALGLKFIMSEYTLVWLCVFDFLNPIFNLLVGVSVNTGVPLNVLKPVVNGVRALTCNSE